MYVDGFVIPVAKGKLAAYRRIARRAGKIWREYGALEYRECVGDDMNVKRVLPFPRLARARRGEMVIFSWIVYRSRAHRDRVNARVMKDPRVIHMMDESGPLFDMTRMAYGGFRTIVDLHG